MSFFVRRIEQPVAIWWSESKRAPESNGAPTLYANCLSGLSTRGSQNAFSVWQGDPTVLDLIIVQLAGLKSYCADSGYLIVREKDCVDFGLDLRPTEDMAIASETLKGRHFNVAVGTADKLLAIGHFLLKCAEIKVKRKKQIACLFKQLSEADKLDPAKLNKCFVASAERAFARTDSA